MTKYKLIKPLESKEQLEGLENKEIGLIGVISSHEYIGIDITIDSLSFLDSKEEIQKIINQLIEKEYIEEI